MATDDKMMVAETIYLYATGIDTKDFNLYRSIFADQVEIDFDEILSGEKSLHFFGAKLFNISTNFSCNIICKLFLII